MSDYVEIDTFSPEEGAAIRLELPGPRAVVLAQPGDRTATGTTITLVLRDGADRDTLLAEVRRLRGRLEFPVLLDTGNGSMELPRESNDEFVVEAPDVTEPEARFRVEAFPFTSGPLSGALYVFAHERRGIASWTRGPWAGMDYPALAPGASAPRMPDDALFLHGLYAGGLKTGLSLGSTHSTFGSEISTHAARVDVRGPLPGVTLDRNATAYVAASVLNRLEVHWEELLLAHTEEARTARGDDAWRYLQELMDAFRDVSDVFWRSLPGTVRYWRSGWHCSSIEDLAGEDIVVPVRHGHMGRAAPDLEPVMPTESDCGLPIVAILDGISEGSRARTFLMRDRSVLELARCGDELVAVMSRSSQTGEVLRLNFSGSGHFVEIRNGDLVACVMPFPAAHGFSSAVLYNTTSSFGAWLQSTRRQSESAPDDSLLKNSVLTVAELASRVAHGLHEDALPTLERFLNGWRGSSDLPSNSRPPSFELTEASFSLAKSDPPLRDLTVRRQ